MTSQKKDEAECMIELSSGEIQRTAHLIPRPVLGIIDNLDSIKFVISRKIINVRKGGGKK